MLCNYDVAHMDLPYFKLFKSIQDGNALHCIKQEIAATKRFLFHNGKVCNISHLSSFWPFALSQGWLIDCINKVL